MPIPQSYLHEKYNIPLPKGDEPIARKQAQLLPIALPEEEDEEDDITEKQQKNDENREKTKNKDHNFFKRLFDFFVYARSRDWASKTRTLKNNVLADALIKQTVDEDGHAYFNAELFRITHTALIKAMNEGFDGNRAKLTDSNFVYEADDAAYKLAMEQNIFHFSASKTLAEMNELNRIFHESKSFEEFRKKAQETTSVFNEKWLKTEYHTAVSVAESASTYRRLMAQSSTFPFWEYRTVGDDRVRQEHEDLEGIILPIEDPRWKKITPPNGWNCRCYIVPRMAHEVNKEDIESYRAEVDKYFGSTEWSRCEAQGFGINRADEAQVFTANQMYINKFPDMSSKILEKITPKEWGVKESLDTLMREAANKVPKYAGTADEWFEANKVTENGEDILNVLDYAGRAWRMTKKAFITHTTDKIKKRAFRTEFLNAIKEIAAEPDEVWLGRELKDRKNKIKTINNHVMIKFYKDKTIAVVGKLEKSKLTLKTWYIVKDKFVRRGMLIRKK